MAVEGERIGRRNPDRYKRRGIFRRLGGRRLGCGFGRLLFLGDFFLFLWLVGGEVFGRQVCRRGKLERLLDRFGVIFFFIFVGCEIFVALIHQLDADDPFGNGNVPATVVLRTVHLRNECSRCVVQRVVGGGAQHEPAA